MAELKFLLGERQSAYLVELASATTAESYSVRHLYFAVQDSATNSVFDGRPVQHVGSNLTIVEGTDDDRDIAGTFEASDASDAYGNPTQVVVEVKMRVPKSTFQQLLRTQLTETVIWAHLTAAVPPRDAYGYEFADLTKARLSFIPKPETQASAASLKSAAALAYSPILERLFWAIVILGLAILWRMH